ncbi:MAG: hypothetical protein ACF788_08750 [Novipirellula sp. JB048]
MMMSTQPIFRYSVDINDVIVEVDDWWLAFARENNAAQLNEATVVGKSLWTFIADEPTRTLYRELHHRVRATRHPITIPFRCDSSTLKRYMQLTIHSGVDRRLCYQCRLIRTQSQRCLSAYEPSKPRTKAFLTMCSFCKRSLIEPSGWLEMENIAIKLRMYETQTVPGLHYTVCPECAKSLRH